MKATQVRTLIETYLSTKTAWEKVDPRQRPFSYTRKGNSGTLVERERISREAREAPDSPYPAYDKARSELLALLYRAGLLIHKGVAYFADDEYGDDGIATHDHVTDLDYTEPEFPDGP